jgi:hypothetical protein
MGARSWAEVGSGVCISAKGKGRLLVPPGGIMVDNDMRVIVTGMNGPGQRRMIVNN